MKTKFLASMVAFKIKIRPLLLDIWFKTFTSNRQEVCLKDFFLCLKNILLSLVQTFLKP